MYVWMRNIFRILILHIPSILFLILFSISSSSFPLFLIWERRERVREKEWKKKKRIHSPFSRLCWWWSDCSRREGSEIENGGRGQWEIEERKISERIGREERIRNKEKELRERERERERLRRIRKKEKERKSWKGWEWVTKGRGEEWWYWVRKGWKGYERWGRRRGKRRRKKKDEKRGKGGREVNYNWLQYENEWIRNHMKKYFFLSLLFNFSYFPFPFPFQIEDGKPFLKNPVFLLSLFLLILPFSLFLFLFLSFSFFSTLSFSQ